MADEAKTSGEDPLHVPQSTVPHLSSIELESGANPSEPASAEHPIVSVAPAALTPSSTTVVETGSNPASAELQPSCSASAEVVDPPPRLNWAEEENIEEAQTRSESTHPSTGLYRSGTATLDWDFAGDSLFGEKDLRQWWFGMFAHHSSADLVQGDILTINRTPSFIVDRLVRYSSNNKALAKTSLRDVRFLRDQNVYVTAELSSLNEEGKWKCFEGLNPKLIQLADRTGFKSHVSRRCLVFEDNMASALMSAIEDWEDDLEPHTNFINYWSSRDPTRESNTSSASGNTSFADDGQSKDTSGSTAGNLPEGVRNMEEDVTPIGAAANLSLPRANTSGTDLEVQPTEATASPTELPLTDQQKLRLQYLASHEGEDSSPTQQMPPAALQLMHHPMLGCCARCGTTPRDGTCECSQSETGKPTSQFASLFKVSSKSIAAQKVRPFVACNYVHCTGPRDHINAACGALHQRCERCHCRGHSSTICPLADGSRTFTQLQADFEAFADHGFLTQHRDKGCAGMGFYPAQSLRCLRYIRATGYNALLGVETEEAIKYLTNIYKMSQAMEGFGPQFQALSDRELRELMKMSSGPTAAKRARPTTPAYAQVAAAAASAKPMPAPRPIPSTSATKAPRTPAQRAGYRSTYPDHQYQHWKAQQSAGRALPSGGSSRGRGHKGSTPYPPRGTPRGGTKSSGTRGRGSSPRGGQLPRASTPQGRGRGRGTPPNPAPATPQRTTLEAAKTAIKEMGHLGDSAYNEKVNDLLQRMGHSN